VPTAKTTETTFRREHSVACDIRAPAARVWALLTDADGFPKWNTTVTSLRGPIALGQKLELRVPLAPDRSFSPRVTAMRENEEMVWSDGFAPMFRGVRTYTLREKDGKTEFAMREVFSGLMLPMIKKSLPDFGPAFETFAADLKRAAEGG